MDLQLNADRFTGEEYVKIYNENRPTPPLDIIYQSLNYLNKVRGERILDLGCGTGISTRMWSDFGDEVIGIEPSMEMLSIAKKLNEKANIKYVNTYANQTSLMDESVDIITCSQSFHWMEPKSTLNEINRVLKERGVLVIYDAMWPPNINFQFENAYNKLFKKVDELTSELTEKISIRWNKAGHLNNIKDSGYFSFLKETYYHKSELLNKEKFIGLAFSQGGLEALLKRGYSENEIGITSFKNKINSIKEIGYEQMTYNYRVIYGIKRATKNPEYQQSQNSGQ